MRVRLSYSISEAHLEVLAAQRAFSVVLDQRVHAGKVQVWSQEEVSVCPL